MLYNYNLNHPLDTRVEWFEKYFFSRKTTKSFEANLSSGRINNLLYLSRFYYELSEEERKATDKELTERNLISFASIGFFWEEKILLKVKDEEFLIRNIDKIINFLNCLMFGIKTNVREPISFINKVLEVQMDNKRFLQKIYPAIVCRN
ncbi:MAG: hypothetical protein N4A44_03350 [Alphaproteobacteria bacterium]|jgi:hypothetical protein|nr:hypothetical protein [Alphaproteobacteria bacterium]